MDTAGWGLGLGLPLRAPGALSETPRCPASAPSGPPSSARIGPNPRLEAKGLARPAEAAPAGRGPARAVEGLEARFGAKDADLAGIESSIRELPDFQARSLERSRASVFALLERSFAGVDPGQRKAVGGEQLAAFRRLLEGTPAPLRLAAAQATLAVFDGRVRLAEAQRLGGGAEGRLCGLEAATRLVEGFLRDNAGRDGLQSALATLPVWIEGLGRELPKLDVETWAELAASVSGALSASAAPSGFAPAALTEATIAFDQARADKPQDPKAALRLLSTRQTRARTAAGKELKASLPAPAAPAGRPEAVENAASAVRASLERIAEGAGGEAEGLGESLRVLAQKVDQIKAQPQQAEAQAALLSSVATILEAHAGTASAPAMVRLFGEPRLDLARAAQVPEAKEALRRAAEEPEAPVGRLLVEASAALRNQRFTNDANAQKAFERLEALGPELATRVGAIGARGAVAQVVEAGTIDALIDLAQHGAADGLDARLDGVGARAQQIAAQLGRYRELAPARQELISTLVVAGLDPAANAAETQAVLQMLQAAQQRLPQAELGRLLHASAHGAGILELANPNGGWAIAPAQKLTQVMAAAAQGAKPGDATEVAQIATALTKEICQIQGGQQLHAPRIEKDFGASVKNPRSLKSQLAGGSMVAVRARGHTVGSFLEAHPHLPIDLAFTAGQHLMPGALAWLSERAEKTRGLATLRNLRDFVFGCVEANRLDLVETLRQADLTSKAVTRVIDEVANAYRGGQAQAVPFDAIMLGLREGRDAVADLAADKARQTLEDLALHDLVEGEVDPAGAAAIASQAENLADLLSQLQPGFKSTLDKEIDYGALRPIFMANLEAVASGRWPEARYTGEVAERLLGGCSDAQREAWIAGSVTSAASAAQPAAEVEGAEDAALLVKGVARAMAGRVDLEAPGFAGRAIDADVVTELRQALDAQLAALRDIPKDQREARRGPGEAAGALRRDLEVAEFLVTVDEASQRGANPTTLLAEARGHLRSAGAVLRREGHTDLATALMDARSVAEQLDAGPSLGRHYAADEDGLAELIGSHTSGCLSKGDKRRRWGMVGALADANIKMLRVYRDGKQVYRTFLKLFDVEMPGYAGPALYVDNPRPDGGGNNQDLELLYRHLLAKGEALGVPVMASANLQKYAQERGWTVGQQNVQMAIDDGHTGYMHSDHLFGGGKGAIRASRGDKPKWVLNKALQVAAAQPPAKDNGDANP